MINIDANTVAVETSEELKTVLEGNNTITMIYLAKDITLTKGIDILGSKKTITIDGLYPTDGTGTIHTYTDMNSASSTDIIGIRSASSVHITVQNLKVVGRNYYGLIYVSEGTNHQDVVVTYRNITYTGPQITYHPSGLSIYYDVNIKIVDSPACVANEVAETFQLQMGGKNTIDHQSIGDSAFWFRGYTDNAYLEILEGATLSITTTRDIIYTQRYVKITIHKNAAFTVNTKYGMFRDSAHQASSILVDENSNLSVIQTQRNGDYATIYCRGDFSINQNATLYMQANYDNAAPLIRFNTNASRFVLTNPKSVILYNKMKECLSFGSTSTFIIHCGKIDDWLQSPTLVSPGMIENNPIYSWYSSTQDNISLTATVSAVLTTVTNSNLSIVGLPTLPVITLLQFQLAHTLRFTNLGSLTLEKAPSVIEFQRPVVSTNPVVLGRKEKVLSLSVVDSRAVSTPWYLYAYIDMPLTTEDKKHSLPNALIFIGEDNTIQQLSQNLTLVYTGTPNGGNPKTTNITWEQAKGILFQVKQPLYNGETYSTSIHWKLSDHELNE